MSSAPNGSSSNPGSAVPISGAADLRSRLVEILSGTANGCLTELGYYPGMPQRMLQVEQLNAKWQSENVKLFQDNQKLTRLLHEKARSNLLAGSDEQRIRAIHALEDQIRKLAEERVNLLKQSEAYHRLHSDYTKLSNLYGAALNEIDQLRNYIQNITTNQQSLQTISRQVTNGQVGGVPGQNSQQYQISQPQDVQWSSQPPLPLSNIPVAIPVNVMLPKDVTVPASQRNASEAAVQAPIDQNNLVPIFQQTMSMNSVDRPILQHNSTPVHSQAPANGSGITYSRSSSHGVLQPPLSVNTSLEFRHHLPTPSSGVTETLPHQLPSLSTGSSPVPLTPSTSAVLETRDVSQEQHPKDPASHPSLHNQSHAISAEVPEGCSEENSSYLSTQAPVNHPFDNARTAQSPSLASHPRSGPDTLKRTSVDMTAETDDEAQQHKKPKLYGQGNSAEVVAGQVGVSEPDMKTDGILSKEEDEESDDGVIEIGPDGLRLEDDCLAALIEEVGDDEELKACKLCNARFEMGYTIERPQPFVRATKEELIQHCSTEHHDAWEELRSSV